MAVTTLLQFLATIIMIVAIMPYLIIPIIIIFAYFGWI